MDDNNKTIGTKVQRDGNVMNCEQAFSSADHSCASSGSSCSCPLWKCLIGCMGIPFLLSFIGFPLAFWLWGRLAMGSSLKIGCVEIVVYQPQPMLKFLSIAYAVSVAGGVLSLGILCWHHIQEMAISARCQKALHEARGTFLRSCLEALRETPAKDGIVKISITTTNTCGCAKSGKGGTAKTP